MAVCKNVPQPTFAPYASVAGRWKQRAAIQPGSILVIFSLSISCPGKLAGRPIPRLRDRRLFAKPSRAESRPVDAAVDQVVVDTSYLDLICIAGDHA